MKRDKTHRQSLCKHSQEGVLAMDRRRKERHRVYMRWAINKSNATSKWGHLLLPVGDIQLPLLAPSLDDHDSMIRDRQPHRLSALSPTEPREPLPYLSLLGSSQGSCECQGVLHHVPGPSCPINNQVHVSQVSPDHITECCLQ